jgi:hypothetical protein
VLVYYGGQRAGLKYARRLRSFSLGVPDINALEKMGKP